MVWSYHFMANGWGKSGNSDRFYFLGLKKLLWTVTVTVKLKDACSLEGKVKVKVAQSSLTLCEFSRPEYCSR